MQRSARNYRTCKELQRIRKPCRGMHNPRSLPEHSPNLPRSHPDPSERARARAYTRARGRARALPDPSPIPPRSPRVRACARARVRAGGGGGARTRALPEPSPATHGEDWVVKVVGEVAASTRSGFSTKSPHAP